MPAIFLCLALVGPSQAEPLQPDEDRRAAAYEEFRRLFAAAEYAQALPLARTVVELTAAADPMHEELPTAWNNLGVVQFRAGDPVAAEASFGEALELLEKTESISSRRLISPLAGLGAVYAATDQPARAADALHRAIAISRRANGLFNVEQLELLEALIESYAALGNAEGIDQERRYALQIVQQAYGYDDPRTLPPLVRLADWFERTDRFQLARLQWARSVEIGYREGGGRNAATINGLLGIARCYRLQYVRDPESMTGPAEVIDPVTGRVQGAPYLTPERISAIRLNPEGERSALQALEILDSTTEPPSALLINTLIELGDWYMTEHNSERAIPYYQRAWPLLGDSIVESGPNPLLTPRPLLYRPPAAATRSRTSGRGPTVSMPIEFSLTVTSTGEPTAIVLLNEVPEVRASQVRRALERAVFSPRFENGQPVATEDYRFTEHWHELASETPDDTVEPDSEAADTTDAGAPDTTGSTEAPSTPAALGSPESSGTSEPAEVPAAPATDGTSEAPGKGRPDQGA